MFYKKRWFLLFVLPITLVFVIVILIPSITGIIGSFRNGKLGDVKPLGNSGDGNNFTAVFQDGAFGSSMGFTVKFAVLTVIFINILGFFLAGLLTKPFKGKNLFRAGFFLPNLIGGLVLGYIGQIIFSEAFQQMGFESWLGTTQTKGLFALVIVVTWQMAGYVMVIYIAQLQNVRKDLSEAASVAGAGKFYIFRKVILPQMMPAFTVALFLVMTRSFQTYDQNLSLTGGAANTNMIAKNIYDTAYKTLPYNLGVAQAKAVIFTAVVSTLALVQVKFTSSREMEA